VLLLSLALPLLSACSGSMPIIEIDTRQLVGRQNMLNEVSRMLDDLGYEHILLQSPIRDQQEPVIDMYGEHRMLYRHPEAPEIRLDVRIRIADGTTVMRFQEQGRKQLSGVAASLFRQLEHRVDAQFGRDNVRVLHRELAAPF
jgi:hypothetical protein